MTPNPPAERTPLTDALYAELYIDAGTSKAEQRLLEHARSLEAQLQEARAECERVGQWREQHMETLRAIASMPVEDGPRMKLWARDSLSGHTESLESTLWNVTQRAERAEADAAQMRDELAYLKRDYGLNPADPMATTCTTLNRQNADLRSQLEAARACIRDADAMQPYCVVLLTDPDEVVEMVEWRRKHSIAIAAAGSAS